MPRSKSSCRDPMPLHTTKHRRRKPAARAAKPCGTTPPQPILDQAAERLGITLADAKHYGVALARWTKAGYPMRPQAEVVRIHTELCEPCPEYLDGRCQKCRCQVNQSRIPLVNKIKMASEHCPLGRW